MKRLFKKQMNKRPNKRRRLILGLFAALIVVFTGVFAWFKLHPPFTYDENAGKQKIEEARIKIYQSSDYKGAIDSLTNSALSAPDSEKYNILIEKGSYLAQAGQLDAAKDTFEQAKSIGGYNNPIVGIALGAYYSQYNTDLSRQHYLGAKFSLESKTENNNETAAALKNVNSQLEKLDNDKK